MYEIEVMGLASGSIVKNLSFSRSQFDITLMDFLRESGLPIASSCKGKGQCRICLVSKSILACSVTLKGLLVINSQLSDIPSVIKKVTITVDYL